METHRQRLFLLVLAALGLAVYGWTLKYPYVQDDWFLLASVAGQPAAHVLLEAFDPTNKLFYRPLVWVYFLTLHRCFGFNTLPHHVLALVIHVANASLAGRAIRLVTGDATLAVLVGLAYLTAAEVHAEPLTWATGIEDLASALAFCSRWSCSSSKRTALPPPPSRPGCS